MIRRSAREAVLVLVGAALVAVVLRLTLFALSYRARADFCLAVGLAAAACWRLARAVAPPPAAAPARFDPPVPDDGLIKVAVLEHRLAWGSVDPDRYRARVHPVLVDLAVERLRSRHGVDPGTQPEVARRILGESLWQLVTGPPPSASPTRPELSRLIEAMERI